MSACAAAGCDNVVSRRPGRAGRPPIYCSPACRPSRSRPAVVVEVDHAEDDAAAAAGRDWVVRLRRGGHAVVVQRGLGRFSATVLAAELRQVLGAGGAS